MAEKENGAVRGEEAALKVLLASRSKDGMTRAEVVERVEKAGTQISGKKSVPAAMSDAATAGTEIRGYRIVRKGRGKYAAEKVAK